MLLIQYVTTHPLALHIHLTYITPAVQEELAVDQLASPLANFFISPQIFTVPSFLSSNRTIICLTHPRSCITRVRTTPIVLYPLARMFYDNFCWFRKSNL